MTRLTDIDVFNRYPDASDMDHTVQIIKYIFPRQFGLHNVFTSSVNKRETVQPFQDYTLRENEMARLRAARSNRGTAIQDDNKVPKRLRGDLVCLIQKLQKRHKACSYNELLKHYCPPEVNFTILKQMCELTPI